MFGLGHKFAVNAEQCDIANPKPSNLFPIPNRERSKNARKKKAGKNIVDIDNGDLVDNEYATFHPEDNELAESQAQPSYSDVPSPPSRVQQQSNR